MRFLIIGGSDAGIAAGLRAHELDPSCEITLLLADEYPNYSICGLPFFLSGETPDWRSLAHRTEFPGIRLMPNHTAESIDPIRKSVLVRSDVGTQVKLGYDKLLIATGARPVQPPIEGLNLAGRFPSSHDGKQLRRTSLPGGTPAKVRHHCRRRVYRPRNGGCLDASRHPSDPGKSYRSSTRNRGHGFREDCRSRIAEAWRESLEQSGGRRNSCGRC